LSFTGPEGGTTFPMRGVSLHWYRELLRVQMVDDFKPPLARSVALALACSVTTAALALAAAQAMRARFRGSRIYFYLILLGVMAHRPPGGLRRGTARAGARSRTRVVHVDLRRAHRVDVTFRLSDHAGGVQPLRPAA